MENLLNCTDLKLLSAFIYKVLWTFFFLVEGGIEFALWDQNKSSNIVE